MAEIGLDLLRNSGEPRPRASRRADVVMTVLSVWFVLGLFLDAYAHADAPELETFFTPWHAVFYSGFAATGGWVLWTVWRHVERGRRGDDTGFPCSLRVTAGYWPRYAGRNATWRQAPVAQPDRASDF